MKLPHLLASFAALFALAGTSGCATAPLRFKDEPVVWRVDDMQNIAEPKERDFLVAQYAADIMLLRRSDRALELRSSRPAQNTNALDEVPDSSWFTNRIGVRELTPEQVVKGPDTGGPPEPPLSIVSAKAGGANPGFIVKDKSGRKFVIKFDPKHNFELQTAAGVITNRFFWAMGYHVPSDHVFWFRPEDLSIAQDAKMENAVKEKVPFSQKRLDEILATAPQLPNGRYRATASELLKGKPKGGFPAEGVRKDDPNDVIPHEHRRELRGLRVFAAWLDHTDMKEDNALDLYVTEDGKSFLRHYLLDFGETLGGHGAEKGRDEDGYENALDWGAQAKALFAFGLWKRPWEDRRPSGWSSVGSVPSVGWDPRQWKEAYPFWPFSETDAADAYWAAKIVMRFDRPMVEALVATGKLSDPNAARYLVDALMNRRWKIGVAYLDAVTSLDKFTIEDGKLCAFDLATVHGIANGGIAERLDEIGKVAESRVIANDGRVCFPAPTGTQYATYRLQIRRAASVKPPMQVHIREAKRVVGIVRTELPRDLASIGESTVEVEPRAHLRHPPRMTATAPLLREELSAVLARFDLHDREPFLADIERLYAPNVFFRDPMQQAKGLPAFLNVNRRMGKGAKEVRFTVKDSTGDDHLFYLHWTMRFEPRLGPALSVEGVSRIRAEGRLVVEHIDYWDLGELFASALPGSAGRKLLHLVFKPFV